MALLSTLIRSEGKPDGSQGLQGSQSIQGRQSVQGLQGNQGVQGKCGNMGTNRFGVNFALSR